MPFLISSSPSLWGCSHSPLCWWGSRLRVEKWLVQGRPRTWTQVFPVKVMFFPCLLMVNSLRIETIFTFLQFTFFFTFLIFESHAQESFWGHHKISVNFLNEWMNGCELCLMFLVDTSSLRQVFITALCHRYKRVCLLSPRVDCKFLGSQQGPSTFLWLLSDTGQEAVWVKRLGKEAQWFLGMVVIIISVRTQYICYFLTRWKITVLLSQNK